MIKVLLFASLAEQAGCDEMTVSEPIHSVRALIDTLAYINPRVHQAICSRRTFLVAVNQQLVKPDATISDGDEIAFMPPVTGG